MSTRELPIPKNESARLRSLRELEILDTPAEERFDRITRLACKHFELPIAAVSMVDEQRQWFKSIQGLCSNETGRDVSFCQYTVMNRADAMVVEDARRDPRFSCNPLVTGEPGIVFYAGYIVRGRDGQAVGSFCVIDTVPRQFDTDEIESLRDFASLVESELANLRLGESQRALIKQLGHLEIKAHVDQLTRLWNRGAVMEILRKELVRSKRQKTPVGLILLDIDHFKKLNDTYGHLGGDEALRKVSQDIRGALREYDAVGRYGGEEFLVVAPGCGNREVAELAERIRSRVQKSTHRLGGERVKITVSLGTTVAGQCERSVKELLTEADEHLYNAKALGRNRVQSKLQELPDQKLPELSS